MSLKLNWDCRDNGSGVAEADYDSIALNHHTSKLTSFSSLTTLTSFGFRGEALSSLCALCESVTVTTATDAKKGVGVKLEMGRRGDVLKKTITARQRGTTVTLNNLFTPLPVRRKEFERNAKREFGKAMALLTGYSLVPCAASSDPPRAISSSHDEDGVSSTKTSSKGVRLAVSNTPSAGKKQTYILSPGSGSTTYAISQALWGSKALEAVQEFHLELSFEAPKPRGRLSTSASSQDLKDIQIEVRGLISKFATGCGRTGTDRQFFYVNGRPCSLSKIQKAFNEAYRSFNANQSPFIVADFQASLEETFSPSRSTYLVGLQPKESQTTPLKQTHLTDHNSISTPNPASPASDQGASPQVALSSPGQTRLQTSSSVSPQQTLLEADQETADFTLGDPHLLIDAPQAPTRLEFEPYRPAKSTPIRPTDNLLQDSANSGPSEVMEAGPVSRLPHSADDPAASDETSCRKKHQLTKEVSSPEVPAIQNDGTEIGESVTAVALDPDLTLVASSSEVSSSPAKNSIREESKNLIRPTTSNPKDTNVRIISTRRNANSGIRVDISGDTVKKPVQLVLKTSGAAWNLARDRHLVEEKTEEHVKKKSRLSVYSEEGATPRASWTGNTTVNLRERLSTFARIGSQIPDQADVDDVLMADAGGNAEEEEECREDESIATPRNLSAEAQGAEEPSVDEPMAVDIDENFDSAHPNSSEKIEPFKGSRLSAACSDSQGDVLMHDPNSDSALSPSIRLQAAEEVAPLPELLKNSDELILAMRFDLLAVTHAWRQMQAKSVVSTSTDSDASEAKPLLDRDAGVSNIDDGSKAAEALSRVIDKTDFAQMDIAGQFNLGFIVTRRRKTISDTADEMDDLFIVDQHAADEKFNFETLQQNTVIKSQRLYKPQPLELTAADELLALDNIDVLRQNGFEVDVAENSGTRQEQKLHLVAQPVSKGTTFDMKDLEELLHLMQDRPAGQMVRCSKARAMFAMRACRKSVMVGKPLNKSQMTSVVQHMGTMDQPWNCPHGRPTMRHLTDISKFHKGKGKKAIDWASLFP
ncbi:hypothetical protein HWV62_35806 [Athelia sp. TMB]|nr:hypothetical protein HWV62_35806 [Athelia sp. TMB]